jgi:hypothetical protein
MQIDCLKELVGNMKIEPSVSHQRLTIIPITMKESAPIDYLLLPEAQEKEAVQVEEVSNEGSVPTLNLVNRGEEPVFVPDGMLLIGGKQNRTVNISLIVGGGSKTEIPVSCVEQGRWRNAGRSHSSADISDTMLRKMMCLDSSESLARAMRVKVDQQKVWNHVEESLQLSDLRSPTISYAALYDDLETQTAEFADKLKPPRNACGVVGLLDGRILSLDIYDKAKTLQQLWPQLLRGYLVESLRRKQLETEPSDVELFLRQALSKDGVAYQSVGIGTTIRLKADNSDGAALMCNNQLVHLAVFSSSISA